jgi:hypothetical protein
LLFVVQNFVGAALETSALARSHACQGLFLQEAPADVTVSRHLFDSCRSLLEAEDVTKRRVQVAPRRDNDYASVLVY